MVPFPPLGDDTKQKSAKSALKSRNQIMIKHACGKDLRYLAFQHHLIGLTEEEAQILDSEALIVGKSEDKTQCRNSCFISCNTSYADGAKHYKGPAGRE